MLCCNVWRVRGDEMREEKEEIGLVIIRNDESAISCEMVREGGERREESVFLPGPGCYNVVCFLPLPSLSESRKGEREDEV